MTEDGGRGQMGCRVCEVAYATGRDGLCDGCRQALTLRRIRERSKMSKPKVQDPEELLELKDEILSRWQKLPPEHRATMLLVLLEKSEWADWALGAQELLERSEKDDPRVQRR